MFLVRGQYLDVVTALVIAVAPYEGPVDISDEVLKYEYARSLLPVHPRYDEVLQLRYISADAASDLFQGFDDKGILFNRVPPGLVAVHIAYAQESHPVAQWRYLVQHAVSHVLFEEIVSTSRATSALSNELHLVETDEWP